MNGKNIGILGLTFKPNTDDARHTQASYIIAKLLDLGANVAVHDPQGMTMFQQMNSHLPIRYCERPADTAVGADAIVLLTHWDEYRLLAWETIYKQMRNRYILDTRNYLKKLNLTEVGFVYEGLGLQ